METTKFSALGKQTHKWFEQFKWDTQGRPSEVQHLETGIRGVIRRTDYRVCYKPVLSDHMCLLAYWEN